MIINAPLSDLTYYTGGIIQECVNEEFGETTLLFTGLTALSNDSTKLEFLSFKDKENMNQLLSTVSKIENKLNLLLQEEQVKKKPKGTIGVKEEIDIAKGLVIRPKEVGRILTERYNQMSPLLQRIFHATKSAIQ
jgi:hypothetical protein